MPCCSRGFGFTVVAELPGDFFLRRLHEGGRTEHGWREPVFRIAAAKAPSSDKAGSDAKRYVRVKYDDRGNPLALETSIVRLVPRETITRVCKSIWSARSTLPRRGITKR